MERYRNYQPPTGILGGLLGATAGKTGKGAGGDDRLDFHTSVSGGITTRPWPIGSHRHYRKNS